MLILMKISSNQLLNNKQQSQYILLCIHIPLAPTNSDEFHLSRMYTALQLLLLNNDAYHSYLKMKVYSLKSITFKENSLTFY